MTIKTVASVVLIAGLIVGLLAVYTDSPLLQYFLSAVNFVRIDRVP